VACLKACHDVVSLGRLAVSIGITAYNILAAVVLLWAAAVPVPILRFWQRPIGDAVEVFVNHAG
jgi:hypothetical protein